MAEDLDLVARTYGPAYDLDAKGRLMLIELKLGDAEFGASKERTFQLVDELMRAGDPSGKRYRGFFVVRTDTELWNEETVFNVNGTRLTAVDFRFWLLGEDFGIPGRWETSLALVGSR